MSSSSTYHHAEWLSLIEISGPFLSVSILNDAFPQGLDAHDPNIAAELRAAYDEWADNQYGLRPEPAIHRAWIDYVLQTTLELPDEVLSSGEAIPSALKFSAPEHGETIRPDIVVHEPDEPEKPRLLLILYPTGQGLEKPIKGKRWTASPAQRMQELLHTSDIRLGLVTNGDQWMLVHARRGETTGFISWDADLWTQEPLTLRSFRSLLSAYRFFGVSDDRTLEALLDASANDQAEVTDQLGYQVRQAVEIIVQTIDRIDTDRGRTILQGVSERELYEAALTVMMRLVFLMSAEERELLPMDSGLYAENYAVSTLRAQLRELADQTGEEILERRSDAWSRLLATFRAVHGGVNHEDLNLPAYGGSLFDPDRFPFLEGRPRGSQWQLSPAHPLPIDNRTVLHLLEALQMLRIRIGGQTELRRLSFRALDIEQIGHVYEGLLDHTAVRADSIILGLKGTRDKEPEVSLDELLARLPDDGDEEYEALVEYVREESGRSKNAILNDIKADEINGQRAGHLLMVCNNDNALYQQVKPFAHLIRDDDFGYPAVFPAGSVYVTAGTTRRATGTHYTPRSLTEPIVQHTLEPLVYVGPAEGTPREKWRLKSPTELLDLKVCDMAMGSGAFLVQVVRYLSERLVEAWDIALDNRGSVPKPNVAGEVASEHPAELLIPDEPEERLVLARRLIVDRCIYGVDKNPLAVEMAKLSLWLVTLEKNRAFTFLDHALKCGDSLVGVDLDQLRFWSLDEKGQAPLFGQRIRQQIDEVIALRQKLESFSVKDIHDQQEKRRLFREAQTRSHDLRFAGDLLLASYFNDLNKSGQAAMRAELLAVVQDGADIPERYADAVRELEDVSPFHWQLEFPEVFLNGREGFDAFVGNPPFMGGQRISGEFGDSYLTYLNTAWNHATGSADYSAYFFLQCFVNLRINGALGLISTNTIAQGATRERGLTYIVRNKGVIYDAYKDRPWPGTAAVVVTTLHIYRGAYSGMLRLNQVTVPIISSQLDTLPDSPPFKLNANSGKSFQGSNILGLGFTMTPKDAKQLIERDPINETVLYPYLNGQDLNSHPDQSPSRWVINFSNWSLEKAQHFPDCFQIVKEKVYPERKNNRNKQRRELWWRFTRPALELYDAIASYNRVIAISQVTKYAGFLFVPSHQVFSHMLNIFQFENSGALSVLQSSIKGSWAERYSSSMGQTLRYSLKGAFETFPFPEDTTSLEDIGERYHETRKQIMLERWEGLTSTYNRFHDPDESADDIQHLRDLHVEMDEAVARAYGWDDLELGHDFHETAQGIRFTISEEARREVLTRLLKLNHERYAEECRQGLHKKKDCEKFFAEHPHLKGDVSTDSVTLQDKQGQASDDENPRQPKLI